MERGSPGSRARPPIVVSPIRPWAVGILRASRQTGPAGAGVGSPLHSTCVRPACYPCTPSVPLRRALARSPVNEVRSRRDRLAVPKETSNAGMPRAQLEAGGLLATLQRVGLAVLGTTERASPTAPKTNT